MANSLITTTCHWLVQVHQEWTRQVQCNQSDFVSQMYFWSYSSAHQSAVNVVVVHKPFFSSCSFCGTCSNWIQKQTIPRISQKNVLSQMGWWWVCCLLFEEVLAECLQIVSQNQGHLTECFALFIIVIFSFNFFIIIIELNFFLCCFPFSSSCTNMFWEK